MDAFELIAKIKMDLSEYEASLNTAEKDGKNFGSKLSSGLGKAAKVGAAAVAAVGTAAAAAGKALYGSAQELAVYGDNIDKMSQKIGISAEAYQEWDAVFQHSGASITSLQAGMKTLNTQLAKVSDEASLAKSPFAELGMSLEEVQAAAKDPDKALESIISHLQELPAGAERSALATKVLGRSGVELGALLNTSAEETQKMRDRVHELGGVMSDEAVKASAQFQDNMQDLKTALDGVKRNITAETLPAFNSLIDGFTKLIAGEEGATEAIDKGVGQMEKAINTIIPKLGSLLENLLPRILEIGGKLFIALAQQVPKIITSIAKQVPKIIKELLKAIEKMFPEMIQAGVELIEEMAAGMESGTGEMIDTVLSVVTTIFNTLIDNAPRLLDAGLTLLSNLIDGIINNLPKIAETAFTLIEKLGTGIIERLPDIIDKGTQIISSLIQGITQNLPKILEMAVELIKKLAKALIDNLPKILDAGVQLITELINGIFQELPNQLMEIPRIITDLIASLLSDDGIGKLLQAGWDIICKIVEGIFTWAFDGTAADLIQNLLEAVCKLGEKLMDIGVQIVMGILDGIKKTWYKIKDYITRSISDVMEAAQNGANQAVQTAADTAAAIEANSKKHHPEWWTDETSSSSSHYEDIAKSSTTQQNRDATRTTSGMPSNITVNTYNYMGGQKVSQTQANIDAMQAAFGGGS